MNFSVVLILLIFSLLAIYVQIFGINLLYNTNEESTRRVQHEVMPIRLQDTPILLRPPDDINDDKNINDSNFLSTRGGNCSIK
jgi:hypothetical protein